MKYEAEPHSASCTGCQILGLIAEKDALRAKIDAVLAEIGANYQPHKAVAAVLRIRSVLTEEIEK